MHEIVGVRPLEGFSGCQYFEIKFYSLSSRVAFICDCSIGVGDCSFRVIRSDFTNHTYTHAHTINQRTHDIVYFEIYIPQDPEATK